jgi:hypothetical protein
MQEVADLDTLLDLASLVEQENATGDFYDSLGSTSSSSVPHASKPRKHDREFSATAARDATSTRPTECRR